MQTQRLAAGLILALLSSFGTTSGPSSAAVQARPQTDEVCFSREDAARIDARLARLDHYEAETIPGYEARIAARDAELRLREQQERDLREMVALQARALDRLEDASRLDRERIASLERSLAEAQARAAKLEGDLARAKGQRWWAALLGVAGGALAVEAAQ